MKCAGFTLVEVLATMILLLLGMLAVLALMRYGLRSNNRLIGQISAFPTAIAALYDARADHRNPFSGDPSWSTAATAPGPTGDYDLTIRGWLNGYYVIRREHSLAVDVLADGHARWADVDVDVYWSDDGRPVAALTERILRRFP